MIQGMSVCYNLHTETQAHDARMVNLHVKLKQTCIKNVTLYLEREGHTYMKCYIMVSCSNVLRNAQAELLLQVE